MEKTRIRRPDVLPEPISHYTDAVAAGGLLWISGMLPVDPEGKIVGVGDVVRQTEQIFHNIELILKGAGASFDDVVKVSLFLLRMDDRPAINTVRRRVFGDSRPASTLVEVSALALPDALLEVETMAVLDGPNRGASA
ncbi:MAG: RidA family protein [Candidatus Dormibacteria bacterium]